MGFPCKKVYLPIDPWSCHEAVISEGWEPGGLDYLCHIIYMYGNTIALYVVNVKFICGYLMYRDTGWETHLYFVSNKS